MPTIGDWKRVHADLMEKLRLPCKLRFSSETKVIGRHILEDGGKLDGVRIVNCCIEVNPEADFRVPEHLILHEAAHHRNMAAINDDDFDVCDGPGKRGCCFAPNGHCKHWAKALCDMYQETGTPLPQTTSFVEFANMAGIARKNFTREGDPADKDA